ncbi:hypothetical protein LEP1GSC051_0538 [Leptospira sp. P2653]|nr:hypothetical protein LEP1GSC051_0538 [Leptospira sp. P2653]
MFKSILEIVFLFWVVFSRSLRLELQPVIRDPILLFVSHR